MLPKMVEIMIEQLLQDNKVLVDYKLLGGNSPLTTIVLKYGDPDHADMIHLGDPTDRRHWSKPGYRTPSQIYRDNGRTQRHLFQRSSQPSDSGVDTFTMSPNEGAFCSSVCHDGGSGKQPLTSHSTRFYEDIHSSHEELGLSKVDVNVGIVDAEVQCMDIIDGDSGNQPLFSHSTHFFEDIHTSHAEMSPPQGDIIKYYTNYQSVNFCHVNP